MKGGISTNAQARFCHIIRLDYSLHSSCTMAVALLQMNGEGTLIDFEFYTMHYYSLSRRNSNATQGKVQPQGRDIKPSQKLNLALTAKDILLSTTHSQLQLNLNNGVAWSLYDLLSAEQCNATYMLNHYPLVDFIFNARVPIVIDLNGGTRITAWAQTEWNFATQLSAANQLWLIIPVPQTADTYTVQNIRSGTFLDLSGSSPNNRTPITGWANNNSNNQSGDANGTLITGWNGQWDATGAGSHHQQWSLQRVSQTSAEESGRPSGMAQACGDAIGQKYLIATILLLGIAILCGIIFARHKVDATRGHAYNFNLNTRFDRTTDQHFYGMTIKTIGLLLGLIQILRLKPNTIRLLGGSSSLVMNLTLFVGTWITPFL
ncbi:hypothetical protein D9757_006905 [Collybiopsis confluens]|uniref:Ricin B lectin domain-containing protein n=1 Tax=Collybiopsis confluens TaxID=2823264 RepID=A0A8H5HPV6_9AGAR|nr:hypothetical protein D9757_011445 [Collybiopsis confluens]KAF5387265.1 hypothetical protein D9757_006905 [Collybiopsis confluens]